MKIKKNGENRCRQKSKFVSPNYFMAALLLKFFSTCPQTKKLYRVLQKTVGKWLRIRRGFEETYVDQAKFILEMADRYLTIQKGYRVLEIGTGWTHWLATVLRLFYDVEIWMLDVVDNRLLEVLRLYLIGFRKLIGTQIEIDTEKKESVNGLIQALSKARSFSDMYKLLGFKYLINPEGKLDIFDDDSFDIIMSVDVLEHIKKELFPEFIIDFGRILKPGGYSIQQFDLHDHLSNYDASVMKKQYLKYSDKLWKRYFENEVQYFNRIQRPEWLAFFQSAGLELVEEKLQYMDIDTEKVDKQWEKFDRRDLKVEIMTIIHKKRSH